MFLGQYERNLDDKGRLAIPPEMRAALGAGAVLARSFDNCLCIYPAAKWDSLARAVDDLPQVRPEVRDLARTIFGGAAPCELDRQGRVAVPAFLREYAGITAGTILLGLNSRVEIWSRESWLREQQRLKSSGSKLAHVLSI
jgi:MraZ protein